MCTHAGYMQLLHTSRQHNQLSQITCANKGLHAYIHMLDNNGLAFFLGKLVFPHNMG
jgi:hypothetical protein